MIDTPRPTEPLTALREARAIATNAVQKRLLDDALAALASSPAPAGLDVERLTAFAGLLEAEWYNGNMDEKAYLRLNADLDDARAALASSAPAGLDGHEVIVRRWPHTAAPCYGQCHEAVQAAVGNFAKAHAATRPAEPVRPATAAEVRGIYKEDPVENADREGRPRP